MNIKLLRKVRDLILDEPRRLDMHDWLHVLSPARLAYDEDAPKCGTVGCIAGWVATVGHKTPKKSFADSARKAMGEPLGVWDQARELLEIDREQSNKLFLEGSWPRQFRNAYDSAVTPRQKANITAKRINHFIKTKGRK